jgi:hypothetical protein
VHLVHQPGRREHVEVAADGHVGHVEQLGELAHAHGSAAANLLQDQELTLAGEHARPTILNRIEQAKRESIPCLDTLVPGMPV